MQEKIQLRLKPAEAADQNTVLQYIAKSLAKPIDSVSGYHILKQSIDARSRQQVWINLSLLAFIEEPVLKRSSEQYHFPTLPNNAKEVVIVGAGPAGLFAALECILLGLRPIVLERGKDVRSRRRDLAKLNKEGIVDTESNYCFGEGGAGTYSDGKLYTRSNKRGSIDKILNLFYQFGADERVLYEAHPHIGTNKLPHIITAMREQIELSGGKVLFEKKLTDLVIEKNQLKEIITADGDRIATKALILATGHSARDIFELLAEKGIVIESKPFALGVRLEHPQALIDSIQYKCDLRGEFLPPSSYSLVEQIRGRGVFSFCMCPGGIIAPAATDIGEVVVNGWSPSKRNGPFANSGYVVGVDDQDFVPFAKYGELRALRYQQSVERSAYTTTGSLMAPAQRMEDFIQQRNSVDLPGNSYLPGLKSVDLNIVLPTAIHQRIRESLVVLGKKMRGFRTNDAILVGVESRTSSPVRIPRNLEDLQHPQYSNLYPCGEGAGYAGGIMSAALDGMRVAHAVAK